MSLLTDQPTRHVDSSGFQSNVLGLPLRAMNVTWRLLAALSLVCHGESKCSPTSYYKNCWIRRFPGVFIDVEESRSRGAQLLKLYQEESALKCSRTCCLTRNCERSLSVSLLFTFLTILLVYWRFPPPVSCNLAIFHYDTAQEHANCFHLHCPSLESCILSHRGNVVLYNITKGKWRSPDQLVRFSINTWCNYVSNLRLVLPYLVCAENLCTWYPNTMNSVNYRQCF